MNFNQTLPFTSSDFFVYIAIALILFLVAKTFLSRIIPYKWLLAFVSLSYLTVLFNKPIHFIALIIYLYFSILALRKWYKSDNLFFPMIILALPMIFMKILNVITTDTESGFIYTSKTIFQIAGISYIVFKVIGLYVDERRKPLKISFLDFFNFTAFVPTLLIGPIDRFQRFKADLNNGYKNISQELFLEGLNKFVKGLLYKFIIAEVIRRLILAHLVDDGSIAYHLAYMYTYLFYLFFDFAGYSLLAIGFGNFLGINVPINFDKPFLAVNPKEFWKKWHKTLGDWLNDYFFKPLFKYFTSKRILSSIQRQGIALFLTFTLMGFWNGFELHYVLSGMLFGLYSVVHNYYVYRCKKAKKDVFFGNLNPKLVRLISIFIMFNFVAFAIYVFSGQII